MIAVTLGCVRFNDTSQTAQTNMAAQSIVPLQQAFSSGHWHSDLSKHCWQYARRQPSTGSIQLAIEVQHCLAGLEPHHIDTADALMHDAGVRSPRIELRLLSAELKLDNGQSAKKRLVKLTNGQLSWSQRRALKRFPMALDWVYRHHAGCLSPRHHRKFTATATLAESLLSSVESTASQIGHVSNQATDKHIAVVGNAPDLLNKKQGEAIDDADLVVRFNQINMSESLEIDVGKRTDLWVVSPAFISRKLRSSNYAQMLTSIEPLSRGSRYWMHLAKQPARSLSLIEPGIWYQLVKELKAPPSSGLLVLRTLRAIAPQASVSCYGFSALATTETSENHYGDRGKASSRHNWLLEAELVRKLASQAKQ